jgi:hypothetical protein
MDNTKAVTTFPMATARLDGALIPTSLTFAVRFFPSSEVRD